MSTFFSTCFLYLNENVLPCGQIRGDIDLTFKCIHFTGFLYLLSVPKWKRFALWMYRFQHLSLQQSRQSICQSIKAFNRIYCTHLYLLLNFLPNNSSEECVFRYFCGGKSWHRGRKNVSAGLSHAKPGYRRKFIIKQQKEDYTFELLLLEVSDIFGFMPVIYWRNVGLSSFI